LDEANLLVLIDKSYKEIWNFCKTDNFPPLYPWLLKLWGYISHNDNWYRLFGALIGALTAPIAFLLGRELLNKKLGWLLGIAAALSLAHIFYSQTVRMFNIQPLFVSLSLFWFLKAIKTNRSLFWFLTGFANLLGFYVYAFMAFIFAAEFLILIVRFRFKLSSYITPFLMNIPFLIGFIVWGSFFIIRYQQLQGNFWTPPFAALDIVKMWVFLSTGTTFRDHYILTILLNIPFVSGLVLFLFHKSVNEPLRIAGSVFCAVIIIFMLISIIGQSFFSKVYFLYLLPIFHALVLAGLLSIKPVRWRRIGIAYFILSMVFSISYYYVDYYELRAYWGFLRTSSRVERSEGHVLSTIDSIIAENIRKDEVIIHYSGPGIRFRSFFPSVYYNKREFPEYLYSKVEVSDYNGRQYMQPDDLLRSLNDLKPFPKGVWMISLFDASLLLNIGSLNHRIPPWVIEENLPLELRQAGFVPVETVKRGKVSAIHYRRETDKPAENAVEP